MIGRQGPAILAASLLAACQTAAPPTTVQPPDSPEWRRLVLAGDRERLDRIGEAWRDGLAAARARGATARVRALGALLEPGAALARAMPPPGSYRCRLVRLGGERGLALFPSHFCHVGVEGELLSFTKQGGSERPGGYLFEDGERRLVFLGALALGDEAMPPAYGADPRRDSVGVVERVGPFRYRLALPRPPGGAALDVLELVPAVPATD